ncbi:cysteine--1-D-myo-inosityl 2-amino-2-deoxy-alpha-D-glucopyranoside ligase [Georgenia muralis]|uniref:L-cysteine:1D-myo-inositol 2-amino-2-deoxy-alpha-D-glucopyranoside ligase n=1 Tax=Georgenia muralis TaxID=154117 RepID=A0A3N4Z730_9MICO|nr:cysteine--1-D-myo-inosityl 2-amino-2-deoxy-alpha-D-glucopyranoside ligase [Georgenia muralis]RPF28127.1 cysteinyl-tRNA synthetase [Georgenia muralis]
MHSWSAPDVPALPGHGARVHLFDSTARVLVPTRGTEEPATLYVCGITPYDATHLGHANTYTAFDLLVRAWRDAGRDVRYVQNVTDVDDPLLERATATGVDWRELAASQIELFRGDMTALRVVPPEHYIGAVESMETVVGAVEGMLGAGTAYRVPLTPEEAAVAGDDLGDVYADTSVDPFFGVGAHLDHAAMVDVFGENGGDPGRPGKRQALDPLLWRRTRAGEPDWDGGTLGRGRPGWHIECACIARCHLGPVVEVQGGGRDLVFPHHEMSESHLRSLTGEPAPVLLHVHAGMVGYHGEKMSKSRGNLVLVSRLLADGADPMAVRLVLLAHHYRTDWEYTDDDLAVATARLGRWREAMHGSGPSAEELLDDVRRALAADLDAPAALAAVDAWVDRALDGDGDGDGDAASDGDASAPAGADGPDLARRAVDALLGVAV